MAFDEDRFGVPSGAGPWRRLDLALTRLETVRRLRHRPRAHRVLTPLRSAAHVTRPDLFVAREELRQTRAAHYTLRKGGLSVHVRHPLIDLWIFDEVFHRRAYDIPAPVAALLGRSPRILDVGAHVGLAGAFLLTEMPDADITALEPDRPNAAILRRTIERNGASSRWRVIEAAATTRDGRARFVSDHHLSRLTDHHADLPLELVQTVDVLPMMTEADLLKLDCEGGEWAIMADARFADAGPKALALELHPRDGHRSDPFAEARALLEPAGYTLADRLVAPCAGAGTLWAWRR